MRLSGVDPGIIRELSGIYKPFIKAFKELISNAYDADAKTVAINVEQDYSAIEVSDDGAGMTPYQFHRDFARLGGSTAWVGDGKSPGGRDRIGYKGIGFLAVARYCSQLRVETHALRPFSGRVSVPRGNRKRLPLTAIAGELVGAELLVGRVAITRATVSHQGHTTELRSGRDFVVDENSIALRSERAARASTLDFEFEVDCSHLVLHATLDFDYLLGLEHRADLRLLEDFCSIELTPTSSSDKSYTRIRLHKLKDFVVRELSAPSAKGKARNIASKSGKDQFLWRIARCSPVRDALPPQPESPILRDMAKRQASMDLPTLTVRWRGEDPVTLSRAVFIPKTGGLTLDETAVPVNIDEKGLRVVGYLLARSEVIYPAEVRGISVRVRNVAIGDASFFGWESLMSGPRKAALSQITGELLVLKGMQAADAINPGRESFYEESTHYRILRRVLFGSEDSIGGLVGEAIRSIIDRIHVRSQITDHLMEARRRRDTLSGISNAVNHYTRADASTARSLAAFFATPSHANGLSTTRDAVVRPTRKLGGFDLEDVRGLSSDYEIDFRGRKVRMDFSQDLWNTTVYLDGNYYEVRFKQGKPEHPVCEFDNEHRRVYVNWGHPAKLHMDDVGFLRSAILLRLASHAAPDDANAMMDLALGMLSFRAE